jgi:hypothetical protein
MKEFLLLIREDAEYGKLSFEEMQADIEKHMAWVEDLITKGQFKDGNPLDSNGKQIKGKEKIVTDGPYIESKECISGYYFLIANSLAEATEIAKGCPALELGATVELREVVLGAEEHEK